MKMCSNVACREMQIKWDTTSCLSNGKDHNLKTKKCSCSWGGGRMKTSTYQGEIKNVTAALEAVWQFLKKLNTNQCMVCS